MKGVADWTAGNGVFPNKGSHPPVSQDYRIKIGRIEQRIISPGSGRKEVEKGKKKR